jgi:hypothetical protein
MMNEPTINGFFRMKRAGMMRKQMLISKTLSLEETVQQSFSLLLHPWHINCAPGAQRAQRGEN